MSSKKNKRHGISNLLRLGIVSLCIYLTASSIGKEDSKSFVLRSIEKAGILTHDTSFMLEQVEAKTGIKTEGNEDFAIFYAVMNNPNLSDDEKELLYNCSDLIRENPYINKKNTYYTLENLKIEYVERDSTCDESVKGIYKNETQTIQIYEPKETIQKEIIIHELLHSIFNNKEINLLPDYFVEGVTELLTNEYFSKTPFFEGNTYPFEIAMTKLLCEMTSPNLVLKAYTTGSMNAIYQEISSIMGIKSTTAFLNNVNTMFEEYKNNKIVKDDLLSEILLFMDSYFKYKYEETDSVTILERYFYNKGILELMKQEDNFKKYWDYLLLNGVYQQAYFSKTLKEQVPSDDKISIDGNSLKTIQYQYFNAEKRFN